MDRCDNLSSMDCKLCGVAYTLPEDDTLGNLPHVLLCGHIFCAACLQSLQLDHGILCPECKVESTLPEGGVDGLQEDSRIIGLIYTTKMNKMKRLNSRSDKATSRRRWDKPTTSTTETDKTEHTEQPADVEKVERSVDEALAQAAENIAQLEHIHQTLAGVAAQAKRDKDRLLMQIDLVVTRATQLIHKRKETLLCELTNMEAQVPSSQAEERHVQERMKALEIAMQKAKQVQRFPSLGHYCDLDLVLDTLQAPVDPQSFNMSCVSLASGLSCVLHSESLSESLTVCMKINAGGPKPVLEDPPPRAQKQGSSNRKASRRSGRRSPAPHEDFPAPQQQDQETLKSRDSSPSPRSPPRSPPRAPPRSPPRAPPRSPPRAPPRSPPRAPPRSFPRAPPRSPPMPGLAEPSPASDPAKPDVIIKKLIEEEQEQDLSCVAGHGDFKVVPPTGPQLANDKWRFKRRKKIQLDATPASQKRDVVQRVLVTHVVNPNHFYIQYLSEKRQSLMLSRRINLLCSTDHNCFSSYDTLKTGSMVFARWRGGGWCRATVNEMLQTGCPEPVTVCPVPLLHRVQLFFLDYGFTKKFLLQSEEDSTKSFQDAVNRCLKKVEAALQSEMSRWAPQAIRCSLKDLVPADLATGWSKEAQMEFRRAVGSAAVEMQVFGADRDCLLVDLKEAHMDRASHVPISVREYLVFIDLARFYCPVVHGRAPLLYYPPVYPRTNTELNAVVSHINNPSDFFIQLIDNMEFYLLSAKLQECYGSAPEGGDHSLHLYCPVVQQACVARFNDHMWYRAQVIGHVGGRRVEVCYVDFGNKEILSVSDLRTIKDEFFSLPAMAIQCCLSDVLPEDGETWSEACIDRFKSLALQKPVTVVATGKTKLLPVRMFEGSLDGPLANIADLLVTEKLACFKEGDTKLPVEDPTVWDSPLEDLLVSKGEYVPCGGASGQVSPGDQVLEALEFQPQLQLPACLKDLKVRVTHVCSPSSFFVQLTQKDAQLKRVCELLNQEYSGTEAQEVEWKADMCCAALTNGVWERGQIHTNVTSSNIAEVLRCDFGSQVKLHVSNLRPLQPSLVGSLSLECTLSNIRPAGGRSTWTATACDFISHYLTGALAVMTVKELTDERPVSVSLFCSNRAGQEVNVADVLVSEGLALKERKPREPVTPTRQEVVPEPQASGKQDNGPDINDTPTLPPPPPPPPHLPSPPPPPPPPPHLPSPPPPPLPSPATPPSFPKPAPRTYLSAEKVKTQLYHPPELPCHGHIQMTVSAIGEDGLIHARTHHTEGQLERLRERIQRSMAALPRQRPYTWKSVRGCAVIGPDMLWYRGQVVEVLGGQVKVCYVDYGTVENIPVVHVYPMLLCEDVPQLCIPCQLHGIIPYGGTWQREAVGLLRELLVNRRVDVQVMELPTEPRGSMTVRISLDGMSLNRILCHHQHASLDPSAKTQERHVVMSPVPLLDDWDIDTEGLKGPEGPMLGPFSYPTLPLEAGRFRVKVKHLFTPNSLFLWPLEGAVEVDGETLEEALARVTADIDALPCLSDFPEGGPCLAEYNDGKYYRAKIMDFASLDPVRILVQHVDYGSDDSLPTSRLRQMPAELLRFPACVLKVRVSGFRAPRVSPETDVLPYCPQWSMKAALDMIDLLHGDITASVVSREPELSVLLYDERGEPVHLPLVASGLADLD